MNILCTGGAGFIGSNLVDLLIKEGHQVTVVDNLSTGKRRNVNPEAVFYQKDITDPIFWKYLEAYDVVYHVAALARIQPSIKDPVPPHNANINGTLNALEYCRRVNAKLVFSASSSIYKGEELPTSEDSPKDIKNPYSLQKYVCEQYIELYGRLYGLDYAILRYFNVYGERQLLEGSYATVIGIFLKQRADKQPLTITGDGEQRRDFTYVGDVVKANLQAINWQGTYNIGAGHNYTINQIADLIGGEKTYVAERPGEVRQTLADNTKAKEAGWQPTVNVQEWLSNV